MQRCEITIQPDKEIKRSLKKIHKERDKQVDANRQRRNR